MLVVIGLLMWISIHTLTWRVTLTYREPEPSEQISIHTLTWRVTPGGGEL